MRVIFFIVRCPAPVVNGREENCCVFGKKTGGAGKPPRPAGKARRLRSPLAHTSAHKLPRRCRQFLVKLFLKSLRAGAAEAPRSPQRAKAPYTAFSFRQAFSFGPFVSKEKASYKWHNRYGYRRRGRSSVPSSVCFAHDSGLSGTHSPSVAFGASSLPEGA